MMEIGVSAFLTKRLGFMLTNMQVNSLLLEVWACTVVKLRCRETLNTSNAVSSQVARKAAISIKFSFAQGIVIAR